DQADGDLGLRADAADGEAVVAVAFQTLDGGDDQRLTARIGQFALEARFTGFSSAALQSGCPLETPPSEVRKYLTRRVVTGGSGDAAARVCSGAAHVQAGQGPTVVAVAEHGARGEHLIQLQRTVHDIATHQSEGAFQVERTHDLPPEYRRPEVGGI